MATTANQIIKRQGGSFKRKNVPCAASIHIYEGTAVFLDAAGRATNVIVDANTIFAGIAINEVDNSAGAADALNVEVWGDGDFELAVTSAALADGGAAVYATDNWTFGKVSTAHVLIGAISKFVSSGIAIVMIRGLGEK